MSDEIVAYSLDIAGTREDAERAAREWGVRIHVLSEIVEKGQNIVLAVCPAEDAPEIFVWHEEAMPRLQKGDIRPGDLMHVEQPSTDDPKALDFSREPKKRLGLRITNPRKIVYDEL